jgi:hypothetical protein
MCGIFGLIGAADKELGERIAQCIHHRGPPASVTARLRTTTGHFLRGVSVHSALPPAVWINPPQATQSAPADAPKLTGVDTVDLH